MQFDNYLRSSKLVSAQIHLHWVSRLYVCAAMLTLPLQQCLLLMHAGSAYAKGLHGSLLDRQLLPLPASHNLFLKPAFLQFLWVLAHHVRWQHLGV